MRAQNEPLASSSPRALASGSPLARPRDGRENAEPRAFLHAQDAVDDLLNRLCLDALSAAWAVWHTDARVKETQIVCDLGDGADRRSRRLGEGALLDRDGRAESLDALDVGFGQLFEELPGVGAERLDVPALPLGIDGVEGVRSLARAARAREDDDIAARQTNADVSGFCCRANDDDDHEVR